MRITTIGTPGAIAIAGTVFVISAQPGSTAASDDGAAHSEAVALMQQRQQPDTTGAAVWAYLKRVNYQKNWQTWPGKGKLYKGQEPHGMLLTTYLNDVAYDALTNKAGRFSPGAIIVKENYMPDSTLAAVTTMYKVAGYNPEAGNWFWVKHLADGSVDMNGMAQGRVAMCISCHGAKKDNDYIFTGALK